MYHLPVLYQEVMDSLNIRPGCLYVDGTLGGGGHSNGILDHLNGQGRLFGIDRDMDAINEASRRLKDYACFTALHGNFHDMTELIHAQGIERVDGILMDLGVSSHQLDTAERGFSYHMDAPLDMRMDTTQGITAADVVNTYDAKRLNEILRDYGEESWSARIAQVILEHRAKAPIRTTGDLVRVVDAAIPRKVRDKDKGHSAQKTFQALRIEVNDELAPLKKALEDAAKLLNPGGRLCVITFHSLEDRIVKQTFRNLENPCTCPKGMPVCVCGKKPQVRLTPRSAIKPSKEEILENSRARSAQLRVAEKLEEE